MDSCAVFIPVFRHIENTNKGHWATSRDVLEGLQVSGGECQEKLGPLDHALKQILKVTELIDPIKQIKDTIATISAFIEEWINKLEDLMRTSTATCLLSVVEMPLLIATLPMCPVDEVVNRAIKPALDVLVGEANNIIEALKTGLMNAITAVIPDETLTIPNFMINLQLTSGVCHSDVDVNLFQGKRNSFNGLALPYTINFQDAALESVGSIALDKITYTTESACEDALASFKNIQGPQCQDLLWDVEKLANQIGQGVTGGYEATVKEGEKVWEQTKKDAAAASDEAARLVQAEKDAAEKEVARLAKEACLIAKCQCGHEGGCCIHCRYCAPRVCHWGHCVGGGCTGGNRDSSNCC